MKKQKLETVVSIGLTLALAAALLVGCGAAEAETAGTEAVTQEAVEAESVSQSSEPATETAATAQYFTKGVYASYPASEEGSEYNTFYVFYDENSGFTDNALSGLGLPFACEQQDGTVVFHMGGADEESTDILTIESAENGKVTGSLQNGIKLVFAPVTDADPDNFSAQNYMNSAKGEDLTYNDANGWSVKYDPSVITVNGGGPMTTFVYTGQSAGTNMITASYNVDKDAKTAIEDLAKSWGDAAQTSEGIFPGTEDVTGYWAMLLPSSEGSGLYETAIARDYMEGYLLFELTGHNSGDDSIDIPVSDALAAIIDSVEFKN